MRGEGITAPGLVSRVRRYHYQHREPSERSKSMHKEIKMTAANSYIVDSSRAKELYPDPDPKPAPGLSAAGHTWRLM